jgi:hypothetical protein
LGLAQTPDPPEAAVWDPVLRFGWVQRPKTPEFLGKGRLAELSSGFWKTGSGRGKRERGRKPTELGFRNTDSPSLVGYASLVHRSAVSRLISQASAPVWFPGFPCIFVTIWMEQSAVAGSCISRTASFGKRAWGFLVANLIKTLFGRRRFSLGCFGILPAPLGSPLGPSWAVVLIAG